MYITHGTVLMCMIQCYMAICQTIASTASTVSYKTAPYLGKLSVMNDMENKGINHFSGKNIQSIAEMLLSHFSHVQSEN